MASKLQSSKGQNKMTDSIFENPVPIDVKKLLADIYLEYRNDYLTISKYAEHKGLHVEHAEQLINLARNVTITQHPES